MYPDWVGPVPYGAGFLAIFIWLGILSFFVWRQGNFLKSLFPKSGERDIRKKFEEVLKSIEVFDKDLNKIRSKLADLENDGLLHIQKVELLRYNPYEDTGGNISFSVSFLDNKGTGIVVTSLHARSGTRIFAKPVIEGKAVKYELSREEEEVIKRAMERK